MLDKIIDHRYHVEAILGRGGMGSVYQATDLVEGRSVALKLLHHYFDMEADIALSRFHREFRVLARLDHPHIVRAYAHGSH